MSSDCISRRLTALDASRIYHPRSRIILYFFRSILRKQIILRKKFGSSPRLESG